MVENNSTQFRCNICNKIYASQSSLCNHNKKFHNKTDVNCCDSGVKRGDNVVKSGDNVVKKYYCNVCNAPKKRD